MTGPQPQQPTPPLNPSASGSFPPLQLSPQSGQAPQSAPAPPPSTDVDRLRQIFAGRRSCVLIPTYEEDHVMAMLGEAAVNLGTSMRVWSYSHGVRDGLIANSGRIKDTEPPAAGLYYLLCEANGGITVLQDIVQHLEDARVLRLLRDLIDRVQALNGHLVLLDHSDAIPEVIAQQVTRFDVSLPSERELVELIFATVQKENAVKTVDAKITPESLATMVRNLRGLTRRQAEQVILDLITVERRLTDADINKMLARKRQMLHRGGLLEYVESPVSLDEIAGLTQLKRWLKQREHTLTGEARSLGLSLQPPKGVLMLGVPGAGKSLCAKAVATAWRRPLLRLDPSVLYDRYIGESERRLREALRQAAAMSPIILWVDEIEKGFASAASRSVDGGLSQRMFGTLLNWMQEHTEPVFLFATANNIEALPPELLRKGRFDEIFFVDLPARNVRRDIFRIHLLKRGLNPGTFDVEQLADASEGYTGSEIEQAIIAASHDAASRKARPETDTVVHALKTSPPLSVTMAEHVQRLRDWATGRCVPAD
ncbi:MAG: AAA family ATPase [Phycisphaera sp.]|nr:AAA family ATPase [Phycisphaera sp.]